jgi:hypothetical protein
MAIPITKEWINLDFPAIKVLRSHVRVSNRY